MSKKTFFSILWLIVGCGGLALAVMVLGKSNELPWQQPPVNPPLLKIQLPRRQEISELAFSQDSKTLIGLGSDLLRWDTRTGRQLESPAQFKGAPKTPVAYQKVAISRNGKVLAIKQQTLSRVVTIPIWREQYVQDKTPKGTTTFTSSGKKKFFQPWRTYTNRTVDLWDIQKQVILFQIPLPDTQPRQDYDPQRSFLSSDGSKFCLVFDHGPQKPGELEKSTEYQLWDVASKKLLWKTQTIHDRYDTPSALFSKDNETVREASLWHDAKGNRTGNLMISNLQDSLSFEIYENDFYPRPFNSWESILLSPDGNLLVGVISIIGNGYSHDGIDGTIVCWNTNTRKIRWTKYIKDFKTRNLTFSPDSQVLAASGYWYDGTNLFATKGKLVMLDSASGELKTTLTEETVQDRWQQNWMQKNKQRELVLDTWRKDLGLGTKRVPPRLIPYKPNFLPGDSGPVTALAFSPDGRTLAAAYRDSSIKLWRVPQE